MKSTHKNNSTITKKALNLTAQVSDAIKSLNKKSAIKNTTGKLARTTNGRTLNPKPNIMTEDDIDKLFKNHSKEK